MEPFGEVLNRNQMSKELLINRESEEELDNKT